MAPMTQIIILRHLTAHKRTAASHVIKETVILFYVLSLAVTREHLCLRPQSQTTAMGQALMLTAIKSALHTTLSFTPHCKFLSAHLITLAPSRVPFLQNSEAQYILTLLLQRLKCASQKIISLSRLLARLLDTCLRSVKTDCRVFMKKKSFKNSVFMTKS